MRTLVRNSFLALVLAVAAAPLAAQEIRQLGSSSPRSGFWFGVGLASANAAAECPDCIEIDNETFPGIDLRIGGTLNPQWKLGLEVSGHRKSGGFLPVGGITETVGDVNLSAYWYPTVAGNFWVQGGLATVFWRAENEDDSSDYIKYAGSGVTLGVGYDIRFGRNGSLTPSVRFVSGGASDVDDPNGDPVLEDWKNSFLQIGMSVIWH